MNQTAKNNIHNIVVRQAAKRDARDVAQLMRELCRYEGVRNSTFSDKDFLRDGIGLGRVFNTLVAEVDGKAQGFMTYYTGYDMPSATRGYHMGDFFIREDFRRLGVGSMMFKELAKLTLGRGFVWISWTVLEKNEPALAFYKKMNAVLRNDVKFMAIGKNSLGKLI